MGNITQGPEQTPSRESVYEFQYHEKVKEVEALQKEVEELKVACKNRDGIIESTNADMLALNNKLDNFKKAKKQIIKLGQILTKQEK